MKPDKNKISIKDNQKLIIQFLEDLIIKPRRDIQKWAEITKQTPSLKIGYVGQHLASLILGMEGGRTGARGHDIIDGTEVKSCTKVDQADKCKDCNERVMRIEKKCSHCGSENIKRNDDSKWLFPIRTEDELFQYTDEVDRVFLLISDYPYFTENNFNTIRFEAFELYKDDTRMSIFYDLLTDYFYNNYKPKNDANKTTAPMNFHPYKYQFYMSNPIKTFSCHIENIDTKKPKIKILHYIKPHIDRTKLPTENMPIDTLSKKELISFIDKAPFNKIVVPLLKVKLTKRELLNKIKTVKISEWNDIFKFIDEKAKKYLQMRDIAIGANKTKYKRN